jgi:hypothetical protein
MSKSKYGVVMIVSLLVLFVGGMNFERVDAALAPKSCKIECQPPTLGLDLEKLRTHVNHGFGINDQFFDVEYFTQTIPTQNFTVGDTVNVRLTIFENSGYQYLRYVGLSIVVDDPLIRGGMMVEEYKSTIEWRNKFDGTKSINVDDSYEIFNVINVTDSLEDNKTVLDYEFIVTNPIESKTITVKMWDKNANVWNNYFHKAITVTEKDSKVIIPFENNSVIIDVKNMDKYKFPEWIQNIFSWYREGLISEEQMIQTLKFLIEQKIIRTS